MKENDIAEAAEIIGKKLMESKAVEFQSFLENLLEYWATRYEKWGNYIDHKENGKKH